MSNALTEHEEQAKVTWGPLAAILVSVSIFLVSNFFVGGFFGGLLVALHARLTDGTFDKSLDWLDVSVVAQFGLSALIYGASLLLLLAFLRFRKAKLSALGFRKPKWLDLAFVFAGFGVYLVLLFGSTALVQALVPNLDLDQKQQIGFDTVVAPWQLVLVFASIVILPAVVEEIVARGFLYSGLKKRLPKILAVVITSVLFAAAHLQFGSGAPLLWAAALDTFILSVVLIYLREITGGLWAPIGLHALKNAIAFVALFILKVV